MYKIDESSHLQFLAVCDAALGVIKKINKNGVLNEGERFAVTDAHKIMFNYTSSLVDENKQLKKKLSDSKYAFNKLALELKEVFDE